MHVVLKYKPRYKPKYMLFLNFPNFLKMVLLEQKLFFRREVLYFYYSRSLRQVEKSNNVVCEVYILFKFHKVGSLRVQRTFLKLSAHPDEISFCQKITTFEIWTQLDIVTDLFFVITIFICLKLSTELVKYLFVKN